MQIFPRLTQVYVIIFMKIETKEENQDVINAQHGCKLLSDIGQCPTKFRKNPTKITFDRTLVRRKNKIVRTLEKCDNGRMSRLLVIYTCQRYWISDRLNSSDVRPKMKVIRHLSCQTKYLFAALHNYFLFYLRYQPYSFSLTHVPSM